MLTQTQLVEAGWCYDPSPEYDDGVTCFYCDLSLDGWEPKDNPADEHRKRSPDCPFFALVEQHAATRAPKKGKKGRGSAASKASRLSTQSNLTVMTDAPTLTSLDDAPAAEEDSILTTATTATTASKATKGRKGAGRAKATAKGAKKGTRGKKASTATVEETQPQPMDFELEEPDAEATPEPPKRTTRRGTKQDSSLIDATATSTESSHARRATRTKAAQPKEEEDLSEDQSQLQAEYRAALEAARVSMNSDDGTPKVKRGTKRTSDGLAKLDSSVVASDALPQALPPAEKPKKGRKGKKAATGSAEPTSSVIQYDGPESQPNEGPGQDEVPEPEPKATGRSRANSKAKRGKKTKPDTEILDPEPETEDELPQRSTERPEQNSPAPAPPAEHTPSPQAGSSASPPPPTPTPARIAPSSAHRSSPIQPRVSNAARAVQRERTPSASPQFSDAENKPPSSRPPKSAARQPLASASSNRQTTRVPLGASTPTASPSKRNVLNGLTSSIPWTSTDLETIFVASPSTNVARSSGFGFGHAAALSERDKENQSVLDRLAGELASPEKGKATLDEVIKKVREALTSPEKRMDVQEWVKWNAQRGEERLKGECERLVGVFEREGGRALRSLEGLECV